jgi:hypothetical protein
MSLSAMNPCFDTGLADNADELRSFCRWLCCMPAFELYDRLAQDLDSGGHSRKVLERFRCDRIAMEERLRRYDAAERDAGRRNQTSRAYAAACALADRHLIPFAASGLADSLEKLYRADGEALMSSTREYELRATLQDYVQCYQHEFVRLPDPLSAIDDSQLRRWPGIVRGSDQEGRTECWLLPMLVARLAPRSRFSNADWSALAHQGVIDREIDQRRIRFDVRRVVRAGLTDRVYVVRLHLFDA